MHNIKQLALNDEGFLGKVARGINDGKTYQVIADESNHKTTMNVLIFLKSIKILVGKMSYNEAKWKTREQAYFKARKWTKENANLLNTEEINHLQNIIDSHENNVNSDSKSQNNVKENALSNDYKNHDETLEHQRSGVYVYSYPLYLNTPISPHDNRTLYKVGASSVSIGHRVNNQTSQTPVPEDIQLLRVFECSDAIKEERKFHRILTAAGHHHQNNHGGIEWFLTRIELIDAIGESLGLFNSKL